MCQEQQQLQQQQQQKQQQLQLSSMSRNQKTKKNADINDGKGIPGKDQFYWSYTEEPHATRRKQILAKYPQIKKLYGYDPLMRYTVVTLVAIQITMAYLTSKYATDGSWQMLVLYLAAAWVIGGTCNHMLMLSLHELSHNLGFKKMIHNRLFAFFANLPLVFPAAISFKRYHMDHHRYQGEAGVDVDVPTQMEGRFFQNAVTKFIYVFCQIFFYALRPLLVCPKKPGRWEAANAITCLCFNTLIFFTMGHWAIFYLLLSDLLGAGLHPVAAHFIAEHFVFVQGAETYSYYGPLNVFAFNVGYHNEHHDFPAIPGSRLPEVRRIAAEFYDHLPQHASWCKVLWDFVMDPNITAFSRVKRHTLSKEDIASIKLR